MIVLSLISRVNKRIAPSLLRHTLRARNFPLLGTFCDYICTPFLQRVISIELQEDADSGSSSAESTVKSKIFPWLNPYFVLVKERLKNAEDSSGKGKTKSSSIPENTARIQAHYDALNKYLRPALLPTDTFSDIKLWRENTRFVAWARREVLLAKYKHRIRASIQGIPELQPSQLESKLPSRKSIIRAFKMSSWERHHRGFSFETERISRLCEELGGGIVSELDDGTIVGELSHVDTCTKGIALEDVIELAGGIISCRRPFNFYCEELGVYDLWTEEYVTALAIYLLDRTVKFDTGETVILEVGAGNGLLSRSLRKCLKKVARKKLSEKALASSIRQGDSGYKKKHLQKIEIPEVIATDDGSWGIKPKSDVETLSVQDALSKYMKHGVQTIVLAAWMPKGVDWTAEMRAAGVNEYILIGESDNGSCGHNWLTWGNKDFHTVTDDADTAIPPYVDEMFLRNDLASIAKLQLSRYDSVDSRSSNTVSFRKLI